MGHFYYSAKQESVIFNQKQGTGDFNYQGNQIKIDGKWVPYTQWNETKNYGSNFDDAVYLGEIENPKLKINGVIQVVDAAL